jgi:hypothetical protein
MGGEVVSPLCNFSDASVGEESGLETTDMATDNYHASLTIEVGATRVHHSGLPSAVNGVTHPVLLHRDVSCRAVPDLANVIYLTNRHLAESSIDGKQYTIWFPNSSK